MTVEAIKSSKAIVANSNEKAFEEAIDKAEVLDPVEQGIKGVGPLMQRAGEMAKGAQSEEASLDADADE